MELVSLGVGLIVNTFLKNKEVHGAINDFVTESVGWVRDWFKGDEKEELIKKVEKNPKSTAVKAELNTAVTQMVKNPKFKSQLEKWVGESKKPFPSMKNVVDNLELETEGAVNIGDKGKDEIPYDKKNVITNSKIKAGGDFNLGDM